MQFKISRMGAAVMKNEDDVIGKEITGGGSKFRWSFKKSAGGMPDLRQGIFMQ